MRQGPYHVALLVGQLWVQAALAFTPPEELLGNTIKPYVKTIEIPRAQLADRPSLHVVSDLGSFDYNNTLHLKFSCSSGTCRRKPCALARNNWCKNFERQQPLPWQPPPRGSKDCPTGPSGLPQYNGAHALCSGVGNCNHDTGLCECPAGWKGAACSEPELRPCTNRLRSSGEISKRDVVASHCTPEGHDLDPQTDGWTASRCIGTCDMALAVCYCPHTTKHGRINAPVGSLPGTPPVKEGRPMGDSCKPKMKGRDGRDLGYGAMQWDALYGPEGWCNRDTPGGHHCGCLLDGREGHFCDIRSEPFCLNQCSGHGTCDLGLCKCHPGWYGTDCSRKKAGLDMEPGDEETSRRYLSSMFFTSKGLPPAALPHPPAQQQQQQQGGRGGGGRLRPLIYVYDLPPVYNTRMLQYRISGGACTWRRNHANHTGTTTWGYMMETYLHEALLTSKHRTFDPEEADFFYVPTYPACFYWPVLGWADHPFFGPAPTVNLRSLQGSFLLLEAKRWVQKHMPYWDRRGGRDHIFYTPMDEGSCFLHNEVYTNATIITHWGRMDLNHTSSTAWGYDNYSNEAPDWKEWVKTGIGLEDWRDIYRGRPCFNPVKDVVIAEYKDPGKYSHSPLLGAPPLKRDILLLLRGDVGFWRDRVYSRGLRMRLMMLAHKHDWWRKHRIAVGERHMVPGDYSQLLARSKFCAVMPGDGWSARAEDAILHGCIPLVVQDQVHMAWEGLLEWDAFALRLKESALNEQLPDVLKAISDEQVERMQRRLALIMPRFAYFTGALTQREVADARRRALSMWSQGGADAEGGGEDQRSEEQAGEAGQLEGWSRVAQARGGQPGSGTTPAQHLDAGLRHLAAMASSSAAHQQLLEDEEGGNGVAGVDKGGDGGGGGGGGLGLTRRGRRLYELSHDPQVAAWQAGGFKGHPYEPLRRAPSSRQDALSTLMAWLHARIPFTR